MDGFFFVKFISMILWIYNKLFCHQIAPKISILLCKLGILTTYYLMPNVTGKTTYFKDVKIVNNNCRTNKIRLTFSFYLEFHDAVVFGWSGATKLIKFSNLPILFIVKVFMLIELHKLIRGVSVNYLAL